MSACLKNVHKVTNRAHVLLRTCSPFNKLDNTPRVAAEYVKYKLQKFMYIQGKMEEKCFKFIICCFIGKRLV